MLIQLHVKNLALIEEIEVEFGPGLNILTGETGAGKSILLGSMQLVLGGKMSREMIRDHAPFALVELIFQVENPRAASALNAMDIYPEDGMVVLSRKLTGTRSICKINGETCTISQMKEAASHLLDIHGQHEHQSLLYNEKQLAILDAYGRERIQELSAQVKEAFQAYRTCLGRLQSMNLDEEQRRREMAFLEFEINEIEEAGLRPGEDEELEKKYRRLNNSKRIGEALGMVQSLTGYEEQQGAGDQVGLALRELSRAVQYDSQLEGLEASLQDIDGLLSDFARELSAYLDELTFDEESFYDVERRLDLLNNLKAKYGRTVEDILEYQRTRQEKLEELTRFEENLEKLHEEKRNLQKILDQKSNELSKIRQEYSKDLEEKIILGLKDLNFLDVRFSIDFSKRNGYTDNGFDKVEYMISTNPGEAMRPLNKVVSGGELSRIMLAIKAILADRDEIDTLIFDEIDTGISGRTAQKVSEKMAVIGAHHQVLCITHLPQIAAMADTHFEIRKSVEGQETSTRIYPLDEAASVEELARLLSGSQVTKAVEENAREMKELALQHKTSRLK